MIHDPALLDFLSSLPQDSFDGAVHRVTRKTADPTAFSYSGGRWAPPELNEGSCSILYTSMEEKGAIAEVASYLSMLTPVPTKSLQAYTLSVAASKTLRLGIGSLRDVGISPSAFPQRNYAKTKLVGAALNFLGLDGLIAPSARWNCDNLMIFQSNHSLDAKLEVASNREVPFEEWSSLTSEISLAEKRFGS